LTEALFNYNRPLIDQLGINARFVTEVSTDCDLNANVKEQTSIDILFAAPSSENLVIGWEDEAYVLKKMDPVAGATASEPTWEDATARAETDAGRETESNQQPPGDAASALAPWAGRWRVERYALCKDGKAGAPESEAKVSLGQTVVIADDRITYINKNPWKVDNVDCAVRQVDVSVVPTEEILHGNQDRDLGPCANTAMELGIHQPTVLLVQTHCGSPFDFFVLRSGELVVESDPILFLTRVR
jgi:hypothetical protein